MENTVAYNSLLIGAIENGLTSLVADRLVDCEYLYNNKGGFVSSTIRCIKDILSAAEIKALVAAKMIGNIKGSNAIVFNRAISNEIKEIATEENISIKDIS